MTYVLLPDECPHLTRRKLRLIYQQAMMFLLILYCQILLTIGDTINSTLMDSIESSQSSTLAPTNMETKLNNETHNNDTDVIIATKFITIPTAPDILIPKDLPNKDNITVETNNLTDSDFSVFVTLYPGRILSLEHINISCTACNTSNILKSNINFKWYLNGQLLPHRKDPNLIYDGSSNPDCKNSYISFIGLSNSDSGTIVCLVTDEKSNKSHSSNYTLNLPAPPLVSLEEFPLPLKTNQSVNISCLSYIPTRMPDGYLSAATITLAGHIVLQADNSLENSIPFHVTEKLRINAGQEFKRIHKEVTIPANAHSFEVTCYAANDFGRFSTGKFVVPIHSENDMTPINIQ